MSDFASMEKALTAGSEQERREAVSKLQTMTGPEAERLVMLAVDDPSHIIQLFAVGALGRFPSVAAVKKLFGILEAQEADEIVQESARAALMDLCLQMPEVTLEQFKRAKSKELRIFLLDIIAMLGTPESMAALKRMALDADEDVRSQALSYLDTMGDDEVVDILMENLTNPDPMSKIASVQALGRLRVARAVPELVRLLDDRGAVAYNVLLALGEIGDPAAVEPLADFLRVKHLTLRHTALDSLVKLGAESIRALCARLDDPDHNMAILASNALGNIGDPAAIPALGRAAGHENENVRYAALEALDKIAAPGALDYFSKAVDDRSRDVVCMAISGLAHLGGAEVVSVLKARLPGSEEEVQFFILDALTQLNADLDKETLAALESSTKNEILIEMARTLVAE